MSKKSNKDYKNGSYKLSKKRLLRDEYEQYKIFGEVDYNQQWLEIFTPTIVKDLFTIMNSCSDNQLKSEYIKKELNYYGFIEVGLGTNIYTMSNPAYPGVIFKFALDSNGIADNFNDIILQDIVNSYLTDECGEKPRYTKVLAKHPSGIVTVQERKVVIKNQDRMDNFRSSVLKTLEKLSKIFLIVDLSPTLYHLNYGVDRSGDWCFIDASDLYPLENITSKIRCKKAVGWDDKKAKVRLCGGRLRYNDDFSNIICESCRAEYIPLEIRPKEKERDFMNSIIDGTTEQEREEMRISEMHVIMGNDRSYTRGVNSSFPNRNLPNKGRPQTIFVPAADELDTVDSSDVECVTVSTRSETITVTSGDTVVTESSEETSATATTVEVINDVTHDDTMCPYNWLLQFIGRQMTIRKTKKNYNMVTTDDNQCVVSTRGGSRANGPIYCDRDVMSQHIGHSIECVVDEDDCITIKCIDCDEIIVSIDNPTSSPKDESPVNERTSIDKITYQAVNVNDVTDDTPPGIIMKIEGDFDKAFDEYGLGLYVQIGETLTLAISAGSFKNILKGIVEDIIEEENL